MFGTLGLSEGFKCEGGRGSEVTGRGGQGSR
jgi:hypothetical protein